MTMTLLHALNDLAMQVPVEVPNPGGGEAPPGSQGLVTLLRWVFYIASGICVLGVIAAGAGMAVSVQRGDSGQHVAKLGWALGGAIVIGVASALVGALI